MKNLASRYDWAGIVGSILFVGVFTIEGWIREGYHAMSMFVSELSLGPRGWIQITNFLIYGALLLIFAYALKDKFEKAKISPAGPILLAVVALAILISGFFVVDPSGTLLGHRTIHGLIHGIAGAIAFTLMPISCFAFFRSLAKFSSWQFFRNWTLIAGMIVAVAVVALAIVTKFPAIRDDFSPWIGLIQRLSLIPFNIWVFTLALKFYQGGKRNEEL